MQRRLFSKLALGVLLGMHSVFPRYLYNGPKDRPGPDVNPREENVKDLALRNYISWRQFERRKCLFDQDHFEMAALERGAGLYLNADYTKAVKIGDIPDADTSWYTLDLERKNLRLDLV